MKTPTCEELFNEELEQVFRTSNDGWRHGSNVTEVYFRESDKTYWQAKYQKTPDGDGHGLREGYAVITQVEPYEVTTVAYRPVQKA